MRRVISVIDFAAARSSTVLAAVGGAVLCIMCLWVVGNVLGRLLFNWPLPESETIVGFMVITVVMFGVAYAQVRGTHVAVDIVIMSVGPRIRLGFEIISMTMGLFLFSVMSYASWNIAIRAYQTGDVTSGVHMLPLFPVRLAMTIGASLTAIIFLAQMGKLASEGTKPFEKVKGADQEIQEQT